MLTQSYAQAGATTERTMPGLGGDSTYAGSGDSTRLREHGRWPIVSRVRIVGPSFPLASRRMPFPVDFAQSVVAEAHELVARFSFDFTRARILREFRQAGAIDPRGAQPYHPRTTAERDAFAALRADAVIVAARPGHYYVHTRASR